MEDTGYKKRMIYKIIPEFRENDLSHLWFPWQFLVVLAEELPYVCVVSAIGPSCDRLVILGGKKNNRKTEQKQGISNSTKETMTTGNDR